MYKPDEKDIDRLSRDAAEHYNAPGKPAWDALQQILDKELPQEKEKKRRGFFFVFLLLLGLSLAGSVVWYGVKINNKNKAITLSDKTSIESKGVKPVAEQSAGTNNPSPEKNASAPVSTAKPTKASDKNDALPAGSKTATDQVLKNKPGKMNAVPASEQDAGNNTGNKTAKPLPASIAKNNSGTNHREETVNRADKQKSVYTGSLDKKQGNENSRNAGIARSETNRNKHTGNKTTGETKLSPETGNEAAADIAANNTSADNIKNDAGIPGKNIDQPVVVTQDTAVNKTIAIKPVAPGQAIIKIDKADSAAPVKKKTKSKNEKAINIGLTAGLDWSTVKFTHGESAGYNLGLMGGYQFSSHWSVYTGLIYTKKNYELNGSDYHPPKHYWTQYVDLENVEGYCRMWEVPLLARYTFNPGSKTAFFASTGISSYFMKKQQYNYSYKTMGVPGTAAWANDSSFNHIFSILHLSAGFEKRLGKHMNWQIEPYAKIPLGGVGFGNIRLSSFGVNLTVQYKHPIKR